ncbi:MAG: hypothetical protein AB8B73_02840 [Ekhidna sp.]
MKKAFMVLMVFALSTTLIYSQDEEESTGVGSGDLLIEITGTPFSGNSLLNFGQFRARYFLSETIVPRLGFFMDLNNVQNTPDVVSNNSTYTFMPGAEYHLQSEGSFRSYAAFDAIIGWNSRNLQSTSGPTVEGSLTVPTSANQSLTRGYFDLGVQLSAGADYHFNSRFYIGAEIGFQLLRRTHSEVTVDGDVYQKSTVSSFGDVNIGNSFRVGFKLF